MITQFLYIALICSFPTFINSDERPSSYCCPINASYAVLQPVNQNQRDLIINNLHRADLRDGDCYNIDINNDGDDEYVFVSFEGSGGYLCLRVFDQHFNEIKMPESFTIQSPFIHPITKKSELFVHAENKIYICGSEYGMHENRIIMLWESDTCEQATTDFWTHQQHVLFSLVRAQDQCNATHDYQWLLEYINEDSNSSKELMYDPRSASLLASIVADVPSYNNNGWPLRDEIRRNLFWAQGVLKDNRYIWFSGCRPHDCDSQAFLWIDLQENVGIIASGTTSPLEGILYITSKNFQGQELPARFYSDLQAWTAHKQIHRKEIIFFDRFGSSKILL